MLGSCAYGDNNGNFPALPLEYFYLASAGHISLGSECLPNHSVSFEKFLPLHVSSLELSSPTAVTTFTLVTPAAKSKNHFLEAPTWLSGSPGFSYPTSTSTIPHLCALCTSVLFKISFRGGKKKKKKGVSCLRRV